MGRRLPPRPRPHWGGTRGTTVATRAFTLVRAADPGGGVRPAKAGPLPLAMRKVADPYDDQMVSLVLVFPLLETPSRCVREVELMAADAPL